MRKIVVVAVVTAALMTAACGDGGQRKNDGNGALPLPPTSASTTTTATTATTAPPPAPPPPPTAPPMPPTGLGQGAQGPLVAWAESHLAALHYDLGTVDDRFDEGTAAAVTAFQKITGLPRTGRLTQADADALVVAQSPAPVVPNGGPDRIEIDLPRQVLLLWKGGVLVKILPVSTGTGKRFCEKGHCGVAVTPPGSYRIGYRKPGWERSPLGRMYNPMYFLVGPGIAIHGFQQVPPVPASHGCVRIPMFAAETLPGLVADRTPVYVFDGTTPLAPIAAGGPQT
ncbi:MAG: L,D-transpeptidase family protein [Actinobacteria bacterium]|nr:L,D-transpeptidase family protein [Actinomycetota bacterium]